MDSSKKLEELPALEPDEIRRFLSRGAVILDLRGPRQFGGGYIPGAINVQVQHIKFKERTAMFILPQTPIILVGANESEVTQAALVLREERREHLLGYALDGIDAWAKAGLPLATLSQISVHELKQRLDRAQNVPAILDVREPFEWLLSGHIQGAILISLGQVERRRSEIPQKGELAIICEHGVRSSTAASVLNRHGFNRCLNVIDGMEGWRKARYPRVDWTEEDGSGAAKAGAT